jgi:hypothetical protein
LNLLLIPEIFKSNPQIVAGVSTRLGGVSTFPFSTLNLGVHTQDDAKNIQENTLLFTQKLGIPVNALARSFQCHGDQILLTDVPVYSENFDAIITSSKGVFPGVGIADCCPILLADPINQVAAAIHAGWKGTVKEIVRKTVEKMVNEYHSNPADMLAYIGPCIGQEYFEVGDEVADRFLPDVKELINGKYHIDLKLANALQLKEIGVKHIEISSFCTIKNNDLFFSFRKENGITGRMLAVIGFK